MSSALVRIRVTLASVLACVFAVCSVGLLAAVAKTDRAIDLTGNSGRFSIGRQWQVVFVGSLHCWPSSRASLVPAVRRIIRTLRTQVMASNDGFATLGVALDESVKDGERFLATYGSFDQMDLGGGWLNESSIHYMLRDLRVSAVTPSLLLVTRIVEASSTGDYVVGPDSIVHAAIGGVGIHDYDVWLQGSHSGAALQR